MSETKVRRKTKKNDFDEAAELLSALNDLCKEKNINPDFLLDALEVALVTAYKKNFASAQNVKVNIDKTTGQFKVYAEKEIVETVEPGTEQLYISVKDAKKLTGKYELGDIVDIEVTPRNFGRVAAMNAKQVITQKIREAEREQVYSSSTKILNDIIPGRIRRIDEENRVFVEVEIEKEEGLETVEALLPLNEIPKSEQPPKQHYAPNMRIMVYVSEVRGGNKGTQVVVSRTHPNLVKKLFIREVPEIADGLVEIKNIAREAGSRTKIAVWSQDPDVDPQGSCIGRNGIRVNQISDELRGEKIDIVKWSEDPVELVTASLSPSSVLSVEINEEEKMAIVTVPENQQSLAIGSKGQNVRLAAKLTGWKIDIKKPSGAEDTAEE
ncbi:MAG: transcription termination/antitermination protein NusA [Clostridia bacterium]|nr:transcription termination/antitermination protein NusA [Clostridia bacterium]